MLEKVPNSEDVILIEEGKNKARRNRSALCTGVPPLTISLRAKFIYSWQSGYPIL